MSPPFRLAADHAPAGDAPAWHFRTADDWPDPTPLALTLLETAGEVAPPEHLVRPLFGLLAERLAAGWRPRAGDLVRVESTLLPGPGPGFVFVPGAAAGTLALVGLTGDEAAAAEQHGVCRVLTLLGRRQHAFPCAPALERGRASLVTAAELAGSVLERIPRVPAPGWTVTPSPERTILRVHPDSPRAPRLAVKNAARGPLAFLLDPVWEARAKGPAAAAFLVLTQVNGTHDQVTALEDGLQLAATARSLTRLAEALEARESMDLPLPDMTKFCVRWTGVRAPQSRAPEAPPVELPPPRPDVPAPQPGFTAAPTWHTFTAALPGPPARKRS